MSLSRLLVLSFTITASALPGPGRSESSQAPGDPSAQESRPDLVPVPIAAPATTLASVAAPEAAPAEPFSWGDFTWMNGQNRQKSALLDTKYFTGSVLIDVNFNYSMNHPNDHTNVGSTATFREGEFDLSFLGFGGDLHWNNVRGRLMTQFGTRATGVPRNDLSPDRGQYYLRDAYRYLSEAYGGYHFDVWNGMNLDVGIFMSYIGLFSYDNFENWGYQPSYTSDNTPWFFQGARFQMFPSDRLKIELWLINGWQSYGMFNEMPGFGTQILWRPTEYLAFITNDYVGKDTLTYNTTCTALSTAPPTQTCSPSTPLANPYARVRFHSDNSFLMRYYVNPGGFATRAALSLTADIGFENGGGVTPFGNIASNVTTNGKPATGGQNFLSWMLYNRIWFTDIFAWTIGGGMMHNPGRYLVLPPTGGASPYNGGQYAFTMNPGDPFDAWDFSTGIQYMPSEYITWGAEYVHRHASVPYFAGPGGVTSATGTWPGGGFDPTYKPDLVQTEDRLIFYMLFRM